MSDSTNIRSTEDPEDPGRKSRSEEPEVEGHRFSRSVDDPGLSSLSEDDPGLSSLSEDDPGLLSRSDEDPGRHKH